MNPPPYVMPEVQELTRDEGRAMLEEMTDEQLGMSLVEFRRKLVRGDFNGSEDFAVNRIVMLLPFAD